jgi:hypothetical protein
MTAERKAELRALAERAKGPVPKSPDGYEQERDILVGEHEEWLLEHGADIILELLEEVDRKPGS